MPLPSAPSFYTILTQAIADMVEHGFDSAERVEYWTRLLREAAERQATPEHIMTQMLRDAMATVYRRLVDRGEVLKVHPGVGKITLVKERPQLRAELDRRILVAANLIKLNRREAIEATLRRFQGWSTSIPAGGTEAAERAKVKESVRKSLASLPFEERRVLIDQGHKLTASINDIIAKDGGAIALIWHSHWRQKGYNYRPDHKERDGKVYALRGNWALERGLMKAGKVGYYDEITATGEEIFCRCYPTYIYALRELPDDMLTARGREELKRAKQQSTARADSAEADLAGLLADAKAHDWLGYARGLKRLKIVPDRSQWHAQYDPEKAEIVLQAKFFREPPAAQLQILLHEIGHRGQDVGDGAYEEFKRRRLNEVSSFLAMANPVHLRDYERTGEVDSIAAEVFAESYARAMLGVTLPGELAEFWLEQLERTRTAA